VLESEVMPMLVVWSMVIGIFLFLLLVVVTLILGAAARESEKDAVLRREQERAAGLSGDITDASSPLHDRYVEA
jgi:membrane protein implicated in regulation of membrane protease activity